MNPLRSSSFAGLAPEGYERWRERFAAALDPRFYTIGHVDALIRSGRARLFTSDRAAILAEIRTYPTGLSDVHGLLAAGELEGIVQLIPRAEAWGRRHGCIGAVIESREGWSRVMKKHGYEPHQVAVRKPFGPGLRRGRQAQDREL